jgi:hypothetical protein
MSIGACGATPAERVSLELRLAQRAWTAWIEASPNAGALKEARLGRDARRTLSALSADDRVRCADWLALLIAACERRVAEAALDRSARADAFFSARVRRAVPERVAALAAAPAATTMLECAVTSGTSARRERRRM